MRAGVIDVDNLVRVRRSFRWRWRIGVIAGFLPAAYGWCFVLAGNEPDPERDLLPVHGEWQVALMMFVLAAVAIAALGSRRGFGRLFFALAAAFAGATLLLWALRPGPDSLLPFALKYGATPYVALGILVAVVILVWTWLLRPAHALLQSAIPLGSWRARGRHVDVTLRTERERRNARRRETVGLIDRDAVRRRFRRLIAVTVVTWLSAGACVVLALRIANVPPAIHPGGEEVQPVAPFLLTMAAYVNLVVFGWCWERWRRRKTARFAGDPARAIPAGGVLLLRHACRRSLSHGGFARAGADSSTTCRPGMTTARSSGARRGSSRSASRGASRSSSPAPNTTSCTTSRCSTWPGRSPAGRQATRQG